MSARFLPPPGAIDPEWTITPSTSGVFLRFGGSGGFAFETPEDAAAVEAGAREARLELERQREAREAGSAVAA